MSTSLLATTTRNLEPATGRRRSDLLDAEIVIPVHNERLALRARFSDAQCGFKAIRAGAAAELLPVVEDEAWFFDTELLVLAQRRGLRIHEVPVDWVEDGDSRVDIVPTALADLRGIMRLLWDRPSARDHRTLPSPRRPMLAP